MYALAVWLQLGTLISEGKALGDCRLLSGGDQSPKPGSCNQEEEPKALLPGDDSPLCCLVHLQGCFPWWTGEEVVAKKAQGKEINGKSNNLNNW